MNLDIKTIFRYFSLILVSIFAIYYLPSVMGTLWLIVLLFLYWFSKDEAFWLAFFFVLSDGFMSFFGIYEATLKIFPGLPGVEVGQFYILLTILKARNKTPGYPLFYKSILNIMGVFLIILILLSLVIGVKGELNSYFRILKLTFPFLLFYSIPRLIKNRNDFNRIFSLIFPIGILASLSQIFEVINLQSVSSFFGARELIEAELKDDEALRSFYNVGIILHTLFGALYYASHKEKVFNPIYLFICLILAFSMAFMSATRGWVIGFGITIILFIVSEIRRKISKFFLAGIFIIALFYILISIPQLKKQVNNSYLRLLSIEKIAEGDVTAGETDMRTSERSPRVMKKWGESPIMGLGVSDEYRKFWDGHVGNQTLLLQSGIIGFSLMMIFFLSFILKMIQTGLKTSNNSLWIFIFFLMGWFVIHSTSGQHFGYTQIPVYTLTQVLFFSFGSFCVAEAENELFYSNM